jgi:hypothetical protein
LSAQKAHNRSGIFSYGFPPGGAKKSADFARETVRPRLTRAVSVASGRSSHGDTRVLIL